MRVGMARPAEGGMSVERLTERTAAGVANINYSGCQFEDGERDKIAESARRQNAIERLAAIEDTLGDTYDLDHLRELVEADKDGRCVVLPSHEAAEAALAKEAK